MKTPAIAQETSAGMRLTPLLERARTLGLDAHALENLAILRGCDYYRGREMPSGPTTSLEQFSNEELAIALLSPSLPATARSIRIAAALLGAEGINGDEIAKLAAEENCSPAVHYIAECGHRYEPRNSFWSQLLNSLPKENFPSPRFPHPTRFIEMTGIDRGYIGLRTQWIRPRRKLAA